MPKDKVRPTSDVYTQRVRYTDDGAFVDRCEFSDVLYEVQSPGPQIVVVYIHGWKHNGDERDTDLGEFTKQLNAIRSEEMTRPHPRRVVGVFVAWNGKRWNIPLVKELTFWGRKRAADRVSQSAAVTKLLSALDSVRLQRKEPRDLTIHVGHSLGARILYNAVAQGLIRNAELAHPGPGDKPYRRFRGFGDIVILLNPALEASLFTTFDSLHRADHPFAPDQPPLLISISSETDRATRTAFPLGQVLTFNWSPKRRTTLGNFEAYRTHELVPRGSVGAQSDAQLCSDRICMMRTPGRPTNNPFISARAARTVIDGHSDIWKSDLRDFLAHVISKAVPSRPSNASEEAATVE